MANPFFSTDGHGPAIAMTSAQPAAPAQAPKVDPAASLDAINNAMARLSTQKDAPPSRTLAQEYKAQFTKRGKRNFQKPCGGAGTCKLALCDHKYAFLPLTSPAAVNPATSASASASASTETKATTVVDPVILSGLHKFCEKSGFKISDKYAQEMLENYDGKMVPAYKALVKELTDRKYILFSLVS